MVNYIEKNTHTMVKLLISDLYSMPSDYNKVIQRYFSQFSIFPKNKIIQIIVDEFKNWKNNCCGDSLSIYFNNIEDTIYNTDIIIQIQ